MIAKIIRRFLAVPILLAWMGLAAHQIIHSVPPLEKVAEAQQRGAVGHDAPSLKAMLHGTCLNEFSSDNAAMIVIEGDQPRAPRRTPTTTASSRS